MRPNTLHAVFTPEHAVCQGGHYYATSTIQDTLSGILHTFVCELAVTNASYPESRFILAEMINFYHTALVKEAITNGQSYVTLDILKFHSYLWNKVRQNITYPT